jgi:hypothetical protein
LDDQQSPPFERKMPYRAGCVTDHHPYKHGNFLGIKKFEKSKRAAYLFVRVRFSALLDGISLKSSSRWLLLVLLQSKNLKIRQARPNLQ